MKNKRLILFLFACVILAVISVGYYKVNNVAQGDDYIHFMSKQETMTFLQNDEDQYVSSLSYPDLHARHVKTAQQYINRIANDCRSFTNIEKQKLQRCCKKADEFLANYTYKGFHCGEIAKMKWCIAVTNTLYEEGFPHTRKNVIFLSNNTINKNVASDMDDGTIVNTLIHEKVHIYQRQYAEIVDEFLQTIGYVKTQTIIDNKRANPDINNVIYKSPYTGKEMYITYSSSTPTSITDVKGIKNYSQEHPYESMAYDIANAYTSLELRSYRNIY